MPKVCFDRIENIARKEKMIVCSVFPQCFSHNVKTQDHMVKGLDKPEAVKYCRVDKYLREWKVPSFLNSVLNNDTSQM